MAETEGPATADGAATRANAPKADGKKPAAAPTRRRGPLPVVLVAVVCFALGGVAVWTAPHWRGSVAEALMDAAQVLGPSETVASDAPGVLFVEAPQVFTRERLVNDRFSEAQWLNAELERTKTDSDDDRFSAAASRSLGRIWAQAGTAPAAQDAEQAPVAGTDPGPPALDPLDVLERRLTHRNRLRTELMDAQLDDGHDLDENTLYRLNFDVTALPFKGSVRRPTALFLFTVQKPGEDMASEPIGRANDDDLALMRDLRAEMEALLDDAVKDRANQLFRKARIENPANVGEPAFFYRMLQHELENRFIEFVVDAADLAGCDATPLPGPCSDFGVVPGSPAPTLNRAVARERVRVAMGLPDRDKEPDAALPNGLQAQFDKARAAAEASSAELHDAARALNPRCLEAQAPKGALREVCDPLPPDPSGQRAMLRLLAVVEALRSAVRESDRWPVCPAEPAQCAVAPAVQAFVAGFAQNIPTQKSIESALRDFLRTNDPPADPPPVEGADAKTTSTGDNKSLERFVAKTRRGPAICHLGAEETGPVTSHLAELFLCPPPQGLREELAAMLVERRLTDTRGDGNPLRRFFVVERPECSRAPCRIALAARPFPALDPGDKGALRNACALRSSDAAIAAHCASLDAGGEVAPASTPAEVASETARAPAQAAQALANAKGETGHAAAFVQDATAKALADAGGQTATAPSDVQERCAQAAVAGAAGEPSATHGALRNSVLTERYTACALRAWLDNQTTDMTVYGLAPRIEGAVRDVDRSLDLALQAAAYGVKAAARAARSETARRSEPYLIGFSDVAAHQTAGLPRDKAAFGWAFLAEDGDTPRAQRLSAILSAPSWWSRVDVKVEACWIDAEKVRDWIANAARESLFTTICNQAGRDIDRTFRLSLPRRAVEVAARFHLDVIRTPYFDLKWQSDLQKRAESSLAVEAGRSGALVLVGERLWRSTVVSLGGQIANRVEVLPDMRGIVAHFDCVQPVSQSEAPLFVWTAEGKAGPLRVSVAGWRTRDRFDAPPCYGAEAHRVEPQSGLSGAALAAEMEQVISHQARGAPAAGAAAPGGAPLDGGAAATGSGAQPDPGADDGGGGK